MIHFPIILLKSRLYCDVLTSNCEHSLSRLLTDEGLTILKPTGCSPCSQSEPTSKKRTRILNPCFIHRVVKLIMPWIMSPNLSSISSLASLLYRKGSKDSCFRLSLAQWPGGQACLWGSWRLLMLSCEGLQHANAFQPCITPESPFG